MKRFFSWLGQKIFEFKYKHGLAREGVDFFTLSEHDVAALVYEQMKGERK